MELLFTKLFSKLTGRIGRRIGRKTVRKIAVPVILAVGMMILLRLYGIDILAVFKQDTSVISMIGESVGEAVCVLSDAVEGENANDISEDLLGPYKVLKVVDGDTISILKDGDTVKVRLIGVDTPESVAPEEYLEQTGKTNTQEGLDASAYTKKLLFNMEVWLELDAGKQDKYGRTLAYVWYDDGGTMKMLNKELLSAGMAKIMTVQPNVAHQDEFLSIQEDARDAERGFWELENVF